MLHTGIRSKASPFDGRQPMMEKTITSIEDKVKGAASIKNDERTELLELLATLKSEVMELSKTHAEQAESITGFAQVSAHEATRQTKNPQLMKLSAKGLSSSVEGFETSHPELVAIVNKISQILANMGI
jgi:Mg2+ and Co2+ transporter CorA